MASPLRPNPLDPRYRTLAGITARNAYERWLAREIVDVLDTAFREVAGRLLTDAADALAPRARQRQAWLFQWTSDRLAAATRAAETIHVSSLAAYGGVEMEAAAYELNALVGFARGATEPAAIVTTAMPPSATLLRTVAELPIEGLPLGDWWAGQTRNMTLATRRAIQQGITAGESAATIARRLVPPARATAEARAASGETRAVLQRARRDARMLVRTSVTAVHAESATTAYAAMGADVTRQYELLTARDARVSAICAALDGRVFAYDDPKAMKPPFHLQCRTTVLPILNHRGLGISEPPARGPLTIPSFDTWLRGQPRTTQAEVLGPARATLYRAGHVTLADLLDGDTRVRTLEQLRAVIAPR